jgi:hypothetical protein
LLVGSGKFTKPWLRMQRANASIAAICARLGAEFWLWAPTRGMKCRQAPAAATKPGDWLPNALFQVRPELGSFVVGGSGKLATPCARMQSVNLIASFWKLWIWAWVGGEPARLTELGELEPQAVIDAAATAATIAVSAERNLNMSGVVLGDLSHECNTPL